MKHAPRRPLFAATAATAVLATALIAPAVPALATSPASEQATTQGFRKAVTVPGITEHLEALQAISDANGGNRAAGSPGYDASVDYVTGRLEAAGYTVTLDEFDFIYNADATPPALRAGSTSLDDSVASMSFSPNGDVTAPSVALPAPPADATPGCETTDFTGFPAGAIAVIRRGACTFATKATNAAAAGASAVVIYNNAPGVIAGTLGGPVSFTIPVVGATPEAGQALIAAGTGRVKVDRVNEPRTTVNVLADLAPKRGADDVMVVGAHLDSVPAGPGINDNGSGSAGILEMAEELARGANQGNGRLQNTVRFAWWGAEEFGLLGSEAYVEQLKAEQPAELARIALNLNFDMIGSPNYGRFIYDGDNSAFPVGVGAAKGPAGSGEIERVFQDVFAAQGLTSAATPFSGRSDYGPFIAEGIPAGGLFTGAEGIKTPAQQVAFGGTAGVAYDACYHRLCDGIGNVNARALDEMGDAAAHAVLVFARRDLAKQPLLDPAPRQENADGINGGGGLHDDHDHEGDPS